MLSIYAELRRMHAGATKVRLLATTKMPKDGSHFSGSVPQLMLKMVSSADESGHLDRCDAIVDSTSESVTVRLPQRGDDGRARRCSAGAPRTS